MTSVNCGPEGMAMEFAKLADGTSCPCSGSASGRYPTGRRARRPCAGRLSSATGISTPPRPTATRTASARRCGTAACPATRCSSPPSSIRGARTRSPRQSRACGGSASTRWTCTWCTGPRAGPIWAWPGMERARERGLARSIGVSNFSAADLDQVIAAGSVAPAVNQIQFSAMEYRRGLVEACRRHGIVPEAYSPLGTGRHLANRRVTEIAARVGRTPAQVLLRWCLQHGVPIIPKSTHRERIDENAPGLRLHPVRGGHGRPRRARPDPRHRPRPGTHLVAIGR